MEQTNESNNDNINLVIITMTNDTPYDWTYKSDWFDSGGSVGTPPAIIKANTECTIKFEKTWGSSAGTSGTISYNVNGQVMTFAFSNPYVGSNKIGVGTDGHKAWENMSSHTENPCIYKWGFTSPLPFNLQAEFENTSGKINNASMTLSTILGNKLTQLILNK